MHESMYTGYRDFRRSRPRLLPKMCRTHRLSSESDLLDLAMSMVWQLTTIYTTTKTFNSFVPDPPIFIQIQLVRHRCVDGETCKGINFPCKPVFVFMAAHQTYTDLHVFTKGFRKSAQMPSKCS